MEKFKKGSTKSVVLAVILTTVAIGSAVALYFYYTNWKQSEETAFFESERVIDGYSEVLGYVVVNWSFNDHYFPYSDSSGFVTKYTDWYHPRPIIGNYAYFESGELFDLK